MIKHLLNSVIAKYRDLSLLATDKSRYFAQHRPIIVNYSILLVPLTLCQKEENMQKLY